MFIFTVLSPVINNIDTPINDYVFAEEETATGDQFLTLDDARTNSKQAGAKAPCPVIQNDGGNTGDTGNATAQTAKSIGSDPTTSFSGCLDSADNEDWYEFSMTASNNIDVTLDNFGDGTTIDYDLYLVFEDNATYYIVDQSASYDPEESVSSAGSPRDGVQTLTGLLFSSTQVTAIMTLKHGPITLKLAWIGKTLRMMQIKEMMRYLTGQILQIT